MRALPAVGCSWEMNVPSAVTVRFGVSSTLGSALASSPELAVELLFVLVSVADCSSALESADAS